MSNIEAVFQNGVFKPLVPIVLPENQRVQLEVKPVETNDILAWLEQANRVRQSILDRHGMLPDTTPDIAEDRMR